MDRLPIDATMGERIRYYRQIAGLTQKTLAEKCGITESAIRNYELGNRIPDWETTAAIAENLEVHFYAIADPKVTQPFGALHALLQLEEIYGLHPVMVDGKVHLEFDESAYQRLPGEFESDNYLLIGTRGWANVSEMHRSGEMSDEEYRIWKSKFPHFSGPDGSLVGWINNPTSKTDSEKDPGKRFRREKKNK